MASTSQPLLLEATAASEATGWRRNQHLIDAMPYIDTLNDQQKQEVEAMMEYEVDTYRLQYKVVNHLPPSDAHVFQDPKGLSQ